MAIIVQEVVFLTLANLTVQAQQIMEHTVLLRTIRPAFTTMDISAIIFST